MVKLKNFQDSDLFEVFINFLIANMYHEIRNRMAMKEKTVHSMKIFNFSCHIENKIVMFLQLIVKNFHLRCGLIGWYDVKSMMFNLFLSFLILVYHISAKKIGMRCETLKFDFSFWYGEVRKFQDLVISECLLIFWLQTCVIK